MATPGTPWIVKKSTIVQVLKRTKGRISRAAKALGVAHVTLRLKIDADPELVKLLQDLRNDFDSVLVDAAENTLLYAVKNSKKDLTNALKSSFFVLNNKGKERGYSAKNNPNNQNQALDIDSLRKLAQVIDDCEAVPESDQENKRPEVENM